jgi:hypothetical protein
MIPSMTLFMFNTVSNSMGNGSIEKGFAQQSIGLSAIDVQVNLSPAGQCFL